jgi:uncharacterized RDD family membrane protein YckC
MKCPKCGYLGFESVDRCRNCGYDFSLAAPDSFELPLNAAREARPLEDLSFLDEAMASASAATQIAASAPKTPDGLKAFAPEQKSQPPGGELPLFGSPIPDDLPLISRPSPPRAPLAVRRATPEVPRLRSTPALARPATLDLGLEPGSVPPQAHGNRAPAADAPASGADAATDNASLAARFIAVVTDLLILAAVDVAVVYFTLQICGIGLNDLGVLPLAPLAAFLAVQNGGYLVAFTASGQTLGKMMAGIRVVSAEPGSPLDLGRAFVRELMWLLLAVPAGLGLLTVLSRDRRGVHDRFAGTRVVRASI